MSPVERRIVLDALISLYVGLVVTIGVLVAALLWVIARYRSVARL
jgi:hypothetical protein